MKREWKLVILGVAIIVFLYFLFSNGLFGLTGYAIFSQGNQSAFDEGTYTNTEYNGSAVVLSSGNTAGNYTSKVFNAGSEAVWNNLSWSSNNPDLENLFCVDGGGDIYKSTDSGITWANSQENYGRTTSTVEMISNSNYLYILSLTGNEVWRSADGTDFALIYNDFGGKSPLAGDADSSGNLYIATGSGEVWKSEDNGETWTLQGDFNGGATNDPKGLTIDSNNYIYAVDGSGGVFKSTNNGVDWTEVNSNYGGSTATDGMESDSDDDLYILLNTEIYKSSDSGVRWGVINDSISPYANTLVEIFINDNDEFFILDAVGRVFESIDSGISWTEIGDCNNEATNDPKGLTDFTQSSNLNLTARTCGGDACSGESWTDITDTSPQDLSLDNNTYFQYNFEFTSPDSSITPSLESVNINYDLINTAPTLTLDFPQQGASYGYNESINLNFSAVDSDDNLESCWYNLDGGEDTSITDCANTTFDVPADGNYNLTSYINDSLGLTAEYSVSFSVQVGAPSIVLNSPVDSYLSSREVTFSYTPTDIDLEACELWGNFTGTFALNQTDLSPTSGIENTFSLTLSDAGYLWNIVCNDSVGNSAVNGNQTFYIDTLNPGLEISQPSGTKTSRTGIPLEFSATDASPVKCQYEVYQGASIEVSNTSTNCSESASFDVSTDANFMLGLYVNDSAGNTNFTTSSFSVDTSGSEDDGDTNGGTSGGGGGGGGTINTAPKTTVNLEIDKIEAIIYPGEEKALELSVKNNARTSVNKCKITGGGDLVDSSDVKNIASGEIVEFAFILTAQEDATPALTLECLEGSKPIPLNVILIKPEIDFGISEVSFKSKSEIYIKYSAKSDSESAEELVFSVYSGDKVIGESVQEISVTKEGIEGEIIIGIDRAKSGLLKVAVSIAGSEKPLVEDSILYDSNSITGFAARDLLTSTGSYVGLIVFVFLVLAFFIIRRILKHRKKRKK